MAQNSQSFLIPCSRLARTSLFVLPTTPVWLMYVTTNVATYESTAKPSYALKDITKQQKPALITF